MKYTQEGNRIERADGKVEAVRYSKGETGRWWGWIVRSTSNRYSYSDPIPTKKRAIEALLTWPSDD